MVKNTGKTASPGAIQPLNTPRPLVVEEKEGLPCRIRITKETIGNPKFRALNPKQYGSYKFLKVASIEDSWRVDEEWWRDKPVARLYFEVIMEDGRRLTVFKEMPEGKWFRQKFW